jgi:hypothetical protein
MKSNQKVLALAASMTIIIALMGCAPNTDSVKNAIRRNLKDPESAQFTDVRIYQGGNVVCGSVNAKNAYGGYVGARDFVYIDARSTYPVEVPSFEYSKRFELCGDDPSAIQALHLYECQQLRVRAFNREKDAKDVKNSPAERKQFQELFELETKEIAIRCKIPT